MAGPEDAGRVRTGRTAQHVMLGRRIAGAWQRHETTAPLGIKAQRLLAGGDETYRHKVLAAEGAIALAKRSFAAQLVS